MTFIVFITSYIYTVLVNPGIPKREYYIKNFLDKKIDKNYWQKCLKCNIMIPKHFQVHHCEDCKVCVMEEDHHCPWTGKCIGKYNIIQFNCFLAGILLFMLTTFMTFLLFLIHLEEEE